MSFPKTIFRFPSGGMSEKVENRTMHYFRSTLNLRGRGSYWEGKKRILPGKQWKKKKILLSTNKLPKDVLGHGD